MNISIIGGDLRIVRLAELYAGEEKTVYTYGLEKCLRKNKKSENIIMCESLKEAVDKSDIIISGMPFSRDGISVNAPFAEEEIKVEELKSKVKDKIFIAGGISKDFYDDLSKTSKIRRKR